MRLQEHTHLLYRAPLYLHMYVIFHSCLTSLSLFELRENIKTKGLLLKTQTVPLV